MPAHIKPAAVAAVPQPQQSLVQRLFAGLGSSELQSALQGLAAAIEGNPDIAQKYLNLAQQAQTSGYYDQLNKRGNKKLQIAEDAATAKLATAAADAQSEQDFMNDLISKGVSKVQARAIASNPKTAAVYKDLNSKVKTEIEVGGEKLTTLTNPITGEETVATTESAQGAREAKSKEAQSRYDRTESSQASQFEQTESRQASQFGRSYDLAKQRLDKDIAKGKEGKTLSSKDAANKRLFDTSVKEIQEIRAQLYDKTGKVNRDVLFGVTTGFPGTEGRTVGQKFQRAVQTLVVAKTGLASTDKEVARIIKSFIPSILDSDQSIEDKIRALEEFYLTDTVPSTEGVDEIDFNDLD